MSAAPVLRENDAIAEINARLRGETREQPLITMSDDALKSIVRNDMTRIAEFRAEEIRSQLKRLGTMPSAQQERAIGEAVGSIPTIDLMRRHSQAFRILDEQGRYDIMTEAQRAKVRNLDDRIEDDPVQGFMFDFLSGATKQAQDAGLAYFAIGSTLWRGAADILPKPIADRIRAGADWLDEGRDAYRDLVMTGQASPFGDETSLLQAMNSRAGKDTWGNWSGNIAFYALPSVASVLRSVQSAKAFNYGVAALMGTQAAGSGIDQYRRHELEEGRTPDPWRAMAVGIGYAAAELAVERLDMVPGVRAPWQMLGTHGASRITQYLMRGDAKGAAFYLANAAGMANAEGIEEVLTGEFQNLIDSGIYGGGADRSWSDRINEYAGGAAGAGFVATLGGSLSPRFREAMMGPPSPNTRDAVERKLITDFERFASSPQGQMSALAQAIASARQDPTTASGRSLAAGIDALTERMGKPQLAERLKAAVSQRPERTTKPVETLLAEMASDIEATTGVAPSVSVVREESVQGVRIIRVAGDLPFPAYATSDPGVIILADGADNEVGLIAHELVHSFRRTHPEVYGELVQAVSGPVLGYAATYANDLAATGVDVETLTPEQRVEEGAARMVEAVAGVAGLKSRLSPTQVGVLTKLGDHFRRAATRLGLRGPVAKAVLRAFDAVQNPTAQGPDKTATTGRDRRWVRSAAERFGMFAVGRSNDDQMILPFGTDLAKAMEELRDVSVPAPHGGTVQATTFTEPRPTARPHLTASMKIAGAVKLIEDTFKARTLESAGLKMELASAMQAALPGRAGQAFANRILDAVTESELRQVVIAAHSAFVNLTAKEASAEAGVEIERVADLLASAVPTPDRSQANAARQQLREMARQFKSADRAQRKEMRSALVAQRQLVASLTRSVRNEERAAGRARAAELRERFAGERQEARRRLADARAEYQRLRTDDARIARDRAREIRRVMLDRIAMVRARFASDRKLFEDLQTATADIIKANLPTEIQGPFLAQLPRAKTMLQMHRLVDKAQKGLERYNRKVALVAAQKAIKQVAKRNLHPAEDAQFVYLAQSVGVLTDKITGKSPSKRRRKIGNAASDLLRQLKVETNDLELVKSQAEGILDRWRARRDGIRSAWSAQVESAATQLASEYAKHTNELAPDKLGKRRKGLPFGNAPVKLLALGMLDGETTAELIFGQDSLGVQLLYRDLRDAHAAKVAAFQADQDFINDVLRRLNIEPGSIDLALMSESIAASFGRRAGRGFQSVTPRLHTIDLPDGGTIELTESEWINLIGLASAQYSRAKITGGQGVYTKHNERTTPLTGADLDHLVATAPAELRAIHDAAKEWFGTTSRERVRQRMLEITGSDITQDDYWPAPSIRSLESETRTEEPVGDLKRAAKLGIMQERVGGKEAVIVGDFFADFLEHSFLTAGIAHQSRPIEFAKSVIDSDAFKAVAQERGLFDYRKHLSNYIRDQAFEYQGMTVNVGDAYFGSTLMRLRNNAAAGMLGLNIQSAAMQTLGVLMLTTQIGPMDVARAVSSRAAFDLSINEKLMGVPLLRQRLSGSPLSLTTGDSSARPGTYGTRPQGAFLMIGQSVIDGAVLRVAWQANTYAVERAMPDATPQQREAEIARRTEDAILRTQPMADISQATAVDREARKNGALAIVTMFTAPLMKQTNVLVRSAMRYARNPQDPKRASRLAYDIGVIGVAIPAMTALIKEGIAEAISAVGGKDDEIAFRERLLREMIANATGMVYGGAYLNFTFTQLASERPAFGSPGSTPVGDTLSQLFRGLVQMAGTNKTTGDSTFWQGLERTAVSAATLSGVPVAPYRLLRKALAEEEKKTKRRTLREAAFAP